MAVETNATSIAMNLRLQLGVEFIVSIEFLHNVESSYA
jgi:hypothetical protein